MHLFPRVSTVRMDSKIRARPMPEVLYLSHLILAKKQFERPAQADRLDPRRCPNRSCRKRSKKICEAASGWRAAPAGAVVFAGPADRSDGERARWSANPLSVATRDA